MDQFENTKKWNKMVRDNSKYHVLWTGLALDCIQCCLTSVDFIHIVQDFFTGIATIPEPIINSGWFMWSIYLHPYVPVSTQELGRDDLQPDDMSQAVVSIFT